MLDLIRYYQISNPVVKFSRFEQLPRDIKEFVRNDHDDNRKLVEIIAYCLMPTHIHLLLKQTDDSGISHYLRKILNSYTRYFNIKHGRKGPLWEGKFKNVIVKTDSQLLHLTRYIHLNPATAKLVENPDSWHSSSYQEFISAGKQEICEFMELLEIKPETYKTFVEDRIDYQRKLAEIKALLLE
ncbi:MAG: transposase [Elusimicrobia bacterium]|nr:transposase [Elusimicrobiota bacterium]